MGCAAVSRVSLIIINAIFLMISIAIIVGGIMLRFYPKDLVDLANLNEVDESTRTEMYIPSLSQLDKVMYISEIGLAMMVFGFFLLILSFCACCGACCQGRILLIVFAVVMVVMCIVECIVAGLFLTRDTVLHTKIKDKLVEEIKGGYVETNEDSFTRSLNMVQYLHQCCGVNGIDDFEDQLPARSCCLKIVMKKNKTKCKTKIKNSPDFSAVGCYEKLQDEVASELPLVICLMIMVLLLQVAEIILAIVVAVEAGNEQQIV